MHLLMCPPEFFDVSYEINPWMHVDIRPNRDRARQQWDALYHIITDKIGARVSLIEPQPDVPDMVFTANAGLVDGNTYIPTTFKYLERQREMVHFRDWFRSHGFETNELTTGPFEGEGDALGYDGMLFAGYGPRSSPECHAELSKLIRREVVSLGLIDERYYHLDVCFAPIPSFGFIYYPSAFDRDALSVLNRLPGKKLAITSRDADHFGANAVVIGHDIVINSGAEDLGKILIEQGFRVHATDLSEFVKAGGSAKCLTLTLEHGS